MWYSSFMPAKLDRTTVTNAEAAIKNAQRVRATHRRRTTVGSSAREDDLAIGLERLAQAMKPIRSEIARFPYGPQTDTAEANRQKLRNLSKQIQGERRRLWKMQDPKLRGVKDDGTD